MLFNIGKYTKTISLSSYCQKPYQKNTVIQTHNTKYLLSYFNAFERFTAEIIYKQKDRLKLSGLFVVPLGLEPRLFCTKNRRVASYTIGQIRGKFKLFFLLPQQKNKKLL